MRADGGLARAYDQIKSAEQDLARLDRLVSGMERGSEAPRASHGKRRCESHCQGAPGTRRRLPDNKRFAIKV